MTFGQPSAFGSFGTGGFSGTGSGAARKPTNPFGTGAGFGASGGTSPWGAASTSGGGMATGVWNPTAPAATPPARTTQTQLSFDRNKAVTPESGWNLRPYNPADSGNQATAAPAPTSPTGPAPTSPTGPGTGTGTGYDWASLLGGLSGGGGGGGQMAALMTNRDPWAEQSAKYVGDNGLVDRWLSNISSGTGDPGYEGLVKSHPMVDADGAKKNLLSYALMKYGLEDQRGAADIYDQLRRAYAGRQQQSQAPAAYVPNTASTTGITLPFPA